MRNFFPVLIAACAASAPAFADGPLDVPGEAKGVLISDVSLTDTLTQDSLLSADGRYYDCWVLSVEPGDDVLVAAESAEIDEVLAILPTPGCTGRAPLYFFFNDAGLPYSWILFKADLNTYGVAVSSVSPDDLGAYTLLYRVMEFETPPPTAYTPSQPEILVRRLYDDDSAYDFSDPAVLDRVFAPATGTAMKVLNAESAGAGLGFDFLVDGQDSDITELAIETRVWLSRSSLIDVRFLNMGEPVHLVFHMRETSDGWRVEDIESRDPDNDQNWVLSQLLGLDLGVAAARQ